MELKTITIEGEDFYLVPKCENKTGNDVLIEPIEQKDYVGKELKFVVNNFIEYNWRRPTRRLALIPIDKIENFKDEDVLFLDDADRFECLMIDLFPCNRRPYAGWKNKTVKIVAVE